MAKMTDSVVHNDTWLKVTRHNHRNRSRRFSWVRVRNSFIGDNLSRRTGNSSGRQRRRRSWETNRSILQRTSQNRPGFQNPKRSRQHFGNLLRIVFIKSINCFSFLLCKERNNWGFQRRTVLCLSSKSGERFNAYNNMGSYLSYVGPYWWESKPIKLKRNTTVPVSYFTRDESACSYKRISLNRTVLVYKGASKKEKVRTTAKIINWSKETTNDESVSALL